MTMRDLVIEQQERQEKVEPKREFLPAIIIEVNGSTSGPQPSTVWVQEFAQPQSVFWVLNLAVSPIPGQMVIIGWPEKPPYTRQVVGYWDGVVGYPGFDTGTDPQLQPHRLTHQYPSEASPGNDAVLVYQPAIQGLKTSVIEGTMSVQVSSLVYRNGPVFRSFEGLTVDMTPYIPVGVGTFRAVLLWLNCNFGSLGHTDGMEIPVIVGLPPMPEFQENSIPSSYVILYDDIVSLTNVDNVLDARAMLSPFSQYASSLPPATRPGEVLFSTDGALFTAQLPVIGDEGYWISGDDGILVVGD